MNQQASVSPAPAGSISSADRPSSGSEALPIPEPGRRAAEQFVAAHLDGLYLEDEVVSSDRFRGGQSFADLALEALDITGYADNRNEAYPARDRGASGLSPYIRHGLLSLPGVWEAAGQAGGQGRRRGGGQGDTNSDREPPARDVDKFRDELLWQEYARHWYARLGAATKSPLRNELAKPGITSGRWQAGVWVNGPAESHPVTEPWDLDMACIELTVGELEDDGWLVNQTRMWLASHWTVRNRYDWRLGEDYFFRHLLDGSRAANRLGWQWTSGLGSNRSYGFSRWQVEKRAPGLCASCEVAATCPIDQWPDEPAMVRVEAHPLIAADPDLESRRGPLGVDAEASRGGPNPEAVWLTAESLGRDDPALAANPELPAVFVFDRALLDRLQLSSKRLVFLVETLAELAVHRPVELYLGDPAAILSDRPLAATFTPVPGWQRRAGRLQIVERHPWPWLRSPVAGNIGSFSAWSRQAEQSPAEQTNR